MVILRKMGCIQELKQALIDSQEAENNASWFETIDQAIAGVTFVENGLATFTPIPPEAIDATSRAIAGVPPGPAR